MLLCSDGLHGSISDRDIQATLNHEGDLRSITKTLVDRALAAGGDDNVTVVVVEYRSTDGAARDRTDPEGTRAGVAHAVQSTQ